MTKPEDELEEFKLPKTLSSKVSATAIELGVDPGEALGRIIESSDQKDEKLKRQSDAAAIKVGTVAPRTPAWARLAGPVAWVVLGLTVFVFVAPFFAYAAIPDLEASQRAEQISTWATHVLAAVVGFSSSVLAYYFGKAQ